LKILTPVIPAVAIAAGVPSLRSRLNVLNDGSFCSAETTTSGIEPAVYWEVETFTSVTLHSEQWPAIWALKPEAISAKHRCPGRDEQDMPFPCEAAIIPSALSAPNFWTSAAAGTHGKTL